MKGMIGYVVAIVGLVVMAVSFGLFQVDALGGFEPKIITGLGVVLVVIGIILVTLDGKSGKKKAKQVKEEVPIYEGSGKNRKIVGYQREKD